MVRFEFTKRVLEEEEIINDNLCILESCKNLFKHVKIRLNIVILHEKLRGAVVMGVCNSEGEIYYRRFA